jgi:hypothetical protein
LKRHEHDADMSPTFPAKTAVEATTATMVVLLFDAMEMVTVAGYAAT